MLLQEGTGFNGKDGNSKRFSSCGRVEAGSASSLPLPLTAVAAGSWFSIVRLDHLQAWQGPEGAGGGTSHFPGSCRLPGAPNSHAATRDVL